MVCKLCPPHYYFDPLDFWTFLWPCCSKEEIVLVWPLITNLQGYIFENQWFHKYILTLSGLYLTLWIFGPSYGLVAQRRKLALFGLSSRIYEDILRTKNTQKNASFCYGCSCYCLFLLWLNSPKTPFLCSLRSLKKIRYTHIWVFFQLTFYNSQRLLLRREETNKKTS